MTGCLTPTDCRYDCLVHAVTVSDLLTVVPL